MEEKAILAMVLRSFSVRSIDERDKLIISGEMVLRSRNGLRIVLTRRKQQKDFDENLVDSKCINNQLNCKHNSLSNQPVTRNI